jgi:hypothetical protein
MRFTGNLMRLWTSLIHNAVPQLAVVNAAANAFGFSGRLLIE